jgi:hypothetical protein
MKRYRYVGSDSALIGETSLGQVIDDVFKVQADRFDHPWSHFWWTTPINQWIEIDSGEYP